MLEDRKTIKTKSGAYIIRERKHNRGTKTPFYLYDTGRQCYGSSLYPIGGNCYYFDIRKGDDLAGYHLDAKTLKVKQVSQNGVET